MAIPRELDRKLFSSPVQIFPYILFMAQFFPKGNRAEEQTSNKLCKFLMARRASSAFGWAVQGLWSDGKSMLPLLLPAQFLQILPTLLHYPQILTTQAPLGDFFSCMKTFVDLR